MLYRLDSSLVAALTCGLLAACSEGALDLTPPELPADGGAPRDGGERLDARVDAPEEPDATGDGSAVAPVSWPDCDRCTADAPLEARSPWPKFRGNMAQTGATRLVPVAQPGARPWSYQTGKGIFSSPVIGKDGAIYIGSADRSFYALEADGTLRFAVPTGEIIDSAALLDDQGRVYFGSGDGFLRALDAATGDELWRFEADPPSAHSSTFSSAFINWFEGNVAIGPSGQLIVPNDNFAVYAIDRERGTQRWKWLMNDQTWSLPAIDAQTGTLYVGNNFIAPVGVIAALWKNVFAIDQDGNQVWRQGVQATIAASPVLHGERVIMGAFDGYLRSYARRDGAEQWAAPTLDHVYASPALLPSGDVVQPSADGTVYCLSPATGSVKWRFDTREPIRSSPAVDGAGHVYFGGGDGRLYVLNADGTRRFSIKLIDGDRNDLNSSPAIGFDAIVLGGENGEIWSVPYDYCLGELGAADPRCEVDPREDLPESGAHLYFVSPFGSSLQEPPSRIARNQPLAFSLFVRSAGDTELALIDESSLEVSVEPASPVSVLVSGDRRFVTVVPVSELAGESATVTLRGSYLTHPTREGLKLSGGTVAGRFEQRFTFALDGGAAPAGLPVPAHPGEPAGTLELFRNAVPLPTILPSYNQIGFDSLHYLVGMVEGAGERGIGWVMGGVLDAEGRTRPDPATKVLFPVVVRRKDGQMTFTNEGGFTVNAMNADIPFETFRASVLWDGDAERPRAAGLHVTTDCNAIPTYGSFLVNLGFCNPQSGMLNVFGSFDMRKHEGGITAMPAGVGSVAFDIVPAGLTTPRKLRATLAGSTLRAADHSFGLFALDTSTGQPLAISYGVSTERTARGAGLIDTVSVPLSGSAPASLRVYMMVDTYPAAVATLRVP
jgi:outer membrane protein assembly factor BamB